MKQSRSILAGLLISAVTISAAQAQVSASIDVSKITCDQLHRMANPVAIALWLNGYYAGKRNDPKIDVISLDRNAEKVSEYCVSNPNTELMKAIETAIGASK
jgi:hypothetical protein